MTLEKNRKVQDRNPTSTAQTSTKYPLALVLLIAFISHSYNMFRYPLYLGDEGIYMEQAWALLREGRLSPYTYWYDHAPGGWMLIAGWIAILPKQFMMWGMAINSGRVLMLLLHLASVFFLYKIAFRMTGSNKSSFITVLFFSLSPLAIYYQRMVLLDNILVFWLLLSFYLLVCSEATVMVLLGSGFAFGIAVITKENAIFFAPVMAYVLYLEVKDSRRYRFGLIGWAFTAGVIVSFYPLYAFLKDELFPLGLSALINKGPSDHVSLIGTVLWQLSRRGGSILDPYGQFWWFFWKKWYLKDALILSVGAVCMLINLIQGMSDRKKNQNQLIAALTAVSFGVYLGRGSEMLEFYVVPILPFLGLNVGLVFDSIMKPLPKSLSMFIFLVAIIGFGGAFIFVARDHYVLDQTRIQSQQLRYIQRNIPQSAVIVTDDDLWVDLHERNGDLPVYPNAHSHWKVDTDPEVRDKLLGKDWKKIDYLIMSNEMDQVIQNQQEALVSTALKNSRVLAEFQEGAVIVQIRQVIK